MYWQHVHQSREESLATDGIGTSLYEGVRTLNTPELHGFLCVTYIGVWAGILSTE